MGLDEILLEDRKKLARIAELGYNTDIPWSECAALMKSRADWWYNLVYWDEKKKKWLLIADRDTPPVE